MAQKRMFTMKIVDSDAFLDMPLSAQCLYFHLCMRADDDGFIGNPKRIAKLIGCNNDDLKLLVAKRFVLVFDSGVIVIKHWRMHNSIQRDRYSPTSYQDELKQLGIKDNKSYTLNNMETKCIQNVSTGLDIGLDKDIDIDIDNSSPKRTTFTPPSITDVFNYCLERNNGIDAQHFVDYYTARGWELSKGRKVKDWKACVRAWEQQAPKNKIMEQRDDTLPVYDTNNNPTFDASRLKEILERKT